MSTFREKYLKYDISSKRTDNLGLKGKPFQTYANAESIEPSLNKDFKNLYLKYKMKYIQLKNQLGGLCNCGNKAESIAECNICSQRVTSNSVASSSAAAMPTFIGDAMPAAAAAMGNAGDINVNVVSMTGKSVLFPISPNATILELKSRIQANNEIGNFEIYRQILVYRLGPHGMEPLADDHTLRQCGIGEIAGDDIEVDLLLDENLLEFNLEYNPELRARIIELLRNSRTEELTKLLSQYVGPLDITERYTIPDLELVPATRWLSTLANALRENTTVTRLSINHGRFLVDEDFILLTNALTQNTTINEVHLLHMNLGDNHLSALADALKVNSNITRIDIFGSRFGDDGAIALAEALKSNNTITEIRLVGNKIGIVGANAFVEALTENETVTLLDLSSGKVPKYDHPFHELQAARPGLRIYI